MDCGSVQIYLEIHPVSMLREHGLQALRFTSSKVFASLMRSAKPSSRYTCTVSKPQKSARLTLWAQRISAMDVVVQHGSKTICFESKSSSSPKVAQGFYNAMEDLKPAATCIVAQVSKRYAFSSYVNGILTTDIADALRS